ncbi:hypothetical protein D3C73_809490 [compost metagenome]
MALDILFAVTVFAWPTLLNAAVQTTTETSAMVNIVFSILFKVELVLNNILLALCSRLPFLPVTAMA